MISIQQSYHSLVLERVARRLMPWPVSAQAVVARASHSEVTNESTDEELAAAILGGDDHAFRVLVERYQSHVVRTVTGMLGKSEEVDDCVQEVFIRLYGSLMNYRGDASVKTYVTRIAINRSLDILRKRKRSRLVQWDDAAAAKLESRLPGPDDEAENSDQRRQLRLALDSLPSKHRTIVVLRMIDGLSTAETADVLGVPYGTVLSRLKRALGKLKYAMGESELSQAPTTKRSL